MKKAPLPPNETERLKSLQQHKILDTLPEKVYDDITRIASEICGTPIALLTLIDENRQWFKSRDGFQDTEHPREISFCAHAILNPNETLVVPDARFDERFHDNPLTIKDPKVIFYAGVPIKDENNLALGTLCVIDSRPRELSEKTLEALKALGNLVTTHFNLRKLALEKEEILQKLHTSKTLASTINSQALELQKNEDLQNNPQIVKILESSASIKNEDY